MSLHEWLGPQQNNPWFQLLIYEKGYTGVLWGLGGGSGIGVPPIVNFGTNEQKERFLPGVADGSIRFCLGITEPDGKEPLPWLVRDDS